MSNILLFTDGSVNTKSKIGYGAYLAINNLELSKEELTTLVSVKRFENTSSSKLELQILLWAIRNCSLNHKFTVYTDSQTIIGLPRRRKQLELKNFSSKKNKQIKNHLLYKEFYKIIDEFDIEFIKVQGHLKSNQKDNIDKIFALVDKAARSALRKVSI